MDSRRHFLGKLFGGFAVFVAVFKSKTAAAGKVALGLDKVPSLSKVGGSATVKLKGKELLLIRDTETSVRVLSGRCTHQNCMVAYNAGSKKIDCKCHGSSFDLSGKVLKGPASVNLPNFPASLSEGRIILTVD